MFRSSIYRLLAFFIMPSIYRLLAFFIVHD